MVPVPWVYRDVPIYWPHELLEYIFQEAGVQIPAGKLVEYWREAAARGLPWAQNLEDDFDPSCRIPIKLFGDDATYNKRGINLWPG